MLIESRKILAITRLQKELTQTVREMSESGESVYIIKNNNMEAVLVPFEEYEYLSKLEDIFEYFEIDEMIQSRLDKYDPINNVEWSSVREWAMYKILLIPEAVKDYKDLDGSVKISVNKKIDELKSNPFLGELLGNKFNIDLSGFYKIYVHGKKFRIVYRLLNPENIEIIEIWGIGKREKEEIYRKIGKRIKEKLGNNKIT